MVCWVAFVTNLDAMPHICFSQQLDSISVMHCAGELHANIVATKDTHTERATPLCPTLPPLSLPQQLCYTTAASTWRSSSTTGTACFNQTPQHCSIGTEATARSHAVGPIWRTILLLLIAFSLYGVVSNPQKTEILAFYNPAGKQKTRYSITCFLGCHYA